MLTLNVFALLVLGAYAGKAGLPDHFDVLFQRTLETVGFPTFHSPQGLKYEKRLHAIELA